MFKFLSLKCQLHQKGFFSMKNFCWSKIKSNFFMRMYNVHTICHTQYACAPTNSMIVRDGTVQSLHSFIRWFGCCCCCFCWFVCSDQPLAASYLFLYDHFVVHTRTHIANNSWNDDDNVLHSFTLMLYVFCIQKSELKSCKIHFYIVKIPKIRKIEMRMKNRRENGPKNG